MLQYLIKFSISLAVLYVFYRALLRPLTFYQCNRFYLLCYSLLSFVIPFIDITPWILGKSNYQLVNIIPVITYNSIGADNQAANRFSLLQRLTAANWILLVFAAGAVVMLVKLILQYLSLRSIRRKAVLLNTSTNVQLFETTAIVSPFSFGNAIYFNRQLHTEEELQRIIQHEFVHVKQKHTIDLLTGELLCVVNWFNPFAWFIRYSIRQNLEFIADNNVVASGLDKKEYQYLLLKVVGASQYSIANNFNFSNLKKRIAMMNQMKTSKLHLAKFLFVLPLMAVLFLAFRKNDNNTRPAAEAINKQVRDTVPPPPPPPVPAVKEERAAAPVPPARAKLPSNTKEISIHTDVNNQTNSNTNTATVTLKDGTKEVYNLNNPKEKAVYIKKYGEIKEPLPPVPPVPVVKAVNPVSTTSAKKSVQPLYVVDSIVEPVNFDIKKIEPGKIESINVIKDPKTATDKYGTKAKNGVVEINTKKDALIIIDGKEMPAGTKIDDYAKPGDIESVDVLKEKNATDKYGDRGKNGAVEIKTKKAVKPAVPVAQISTTGAGYATLL